MQWPDRIVREEVSRVFSELQKEAGSKVSQHRPVQRFLDVDGKTVRHIPGGPVSLIMETTLHKAY